MGFYVREYYCGNEPVTLHLTLLSRGCPAPTDPTDTTPILQVTKISPVLSVAARGEGGGVVGYPDPENTLVTIPTPITPWVHLQRDVLTEADLPVLRDRLASALQMVEAGIAELQATPEQLAGLSRAIETQQG